MNTAGMLDEAGDIAYKNKLSKKELYSSSVYLHFKIQRLSLSSPYQQRYNISAHNGFNFNVNSKNSSFAFITFKYNKIILTTLVT